MVSGLFWFLFAFLMIPFRDVRFGFVDPINIGHFYYNFLDFRKMQWVDREGRNSKKSLYLWEVFKPVSNNVALQLVKNQLGLHHSLFGVRGAHAFCMRIGATRFLMTRVSNRTIDVDDCFGLSSEFFSLPQTERRAKSIQWIKQMSENRPVACLHIRDGAYRLSRRSVYRGSPDEGRFRNPPTQSFIDVIGYLISEGFFVVKVGSLSEQPFPFRSKHFFDYSQSEYRSEYLDVFLAWYCSIFVGCASGYSFLPAVFGKPIVFTNYLPGNLLINYEPGVSLVAGLYSDRLQRNLTARESLRIVYGSTLADSDLAEKGLRVIHNSNQEILDATRFLLHASSLKSPLQLSPIISDFWGEYNQQIPHNLAIRMTLLESNLGNAFPDLRARQR